MKLATGFLRGVALTACWIGCVGFAYYLDLFDTRWFDHLFNWDDRLRFALALQGYGTIGCWFYAATGRQGVDFRGVPLPDMPERMCVASLLSVVAFIVMFIIVSM